MNTDTQMKRARSLRWGFPALFLIAGFMIARTALDIGAPSRLAAGALLLVVGGGMYFSFRWARWLMMGACFLIVVLACAYPMIVVVSRPFAHMEMPLQGAVLFGVFAFVAGALAFKYLSYLRSDLGRVHHAVKRTDGSASVLVSAMLWAMVIFLLIATHSRMTT